MLWSFAGVGEFADTFMCAIETITSKTKTAVDDEGDQQFVKVSHSDELSGERHSHAQN